MYFEGERDRGEDCWKGARRSCGGKEQSEGGDEMV